MSPTKEAVASRPRVSMVKFYNCLILLFMLCSFPMVAGVNKVYPGKGVIKSSGMRTSNGYRSFRYFSDTKAQKPNVEVSLFDYWQLQNAAVFQNRLILLTTSSNTYRFTIVDTKNGKTIDDCWGAFARISPSGRFIVFMRWEGRGIKPKNMIPVGETRIYDVTKFPRDNRTQQGKEELKFNPIDAGNQSRNCGIPVYPQGNSNKSEYAWVDTNEKSVAPMTNYFWYNDFSFIFSTHSFAKNTPTLVNASFDQKAQIFRIETKTLAGNEFQLPGEPEAPSLELSNIKKSGEFIELYEGPIVLRIPDFAATEK